METFNLEKLIDVVNDADEPISISINRKEKQGSSEIGFSGDGLSLICALLVALQSLQDRLDMDDDEAMLLKRIAKEIYSH